MDCEHENSVLWNPFNAVRQCHRCGEAIDDTKIKLGRLSDDQLDRIELLKQRIMELMLDSVKSPIGRR